MGIQTGSTIEREFNEHLRGNFIFVIIALIAMGFAAGFVVGYHIAFVEIFRIAESVLNNPNLLNTFYRQFG